MPNYFVVRRTFKCANGRFLAGSVVEPAEIKGFKYKVRDGLVLEVTEQSFERYARYFKEKYNIDIPDPSTMGQSTSSDLCRPVDPSTYADTVISTDPGVTISANLDVNPEDNLHVNPEDNLYVNPEDNLHVGGNPAVTVTSVQGVLLGRIIS